MEYIEQDCCITHDGKSYCSGGAFVNPGFIVAYPAKNGILTDWHGKPIGTWKATSSWKLPLTAWIADRMYQIESIVDGTKYTGRGCGVDMLYRGKRKARQ
jgi:hypothetical protein